MATSGAAAWNGVALGDLAQRIGAQLHGNPDARVFSVATLDGAVAGQVTFLFNRKYRRFLSVTAASAVILAPADAAECRAAALVMENPYLGYAKATRILHPETLPAAGVHPTAVVEAGAEVDATACIEAHAFVAATAVVGAHVRVGPGCVVSAGARVGDYTELTANVTLCRGVRIGRRCLLHPGAVIGADGFGLARDGERWVKVPQIGSVQIGDDVEIGANTTIDRGALKDTMIGDGVKLDNLVQVGHNVRIGAHTAIAGCTGIAGSVTIGRRCMIGGAVGIAGHLDIGDDVVVTGMTMVSRSLSGPGTYSSGWPAREALSWRRTVAWLHRRSRRNGGEQGD